MKHIRISPWLILVLRSGRSLPPDVIDLIRKWPSIRHSQ